MLKHYNLSKLLRRSFNIAYLQATLVNSVVLNKERILEAIKLKIHEGSVLTCLPSRV